MRRRERNREMKEGEGVGLRKLDFFDEFLVFGVGALAVVATTNLEPSLSDTWRQKTNPYRDEDHDGLSFGRGGKLVLGPSRAAQQIAIGVQCRAEGSHMKGHHS